MRASSLILAMALLAAGPAQASPIVWKLQGVFDEGPAVAAGTPFELSMRFDPGQAEAGTVIAGTIQLVFGPAFELRLAYDDVVRSSLEAGEFTMSGGYCWGTIGFGAPSCNEVSAASGSARAVDPMPFGFRLEGPLDSFLPPFGTTDPIEWIPQDPPDLGVLTTARVTLWDPLGLGTPADPVVGRGTITRAVRVPEARVITLGFVAAGLAGLFARSLFAEVPPGAAASKVPISSMRRPTSTTPPPGKRLAP